MNILTISLQANDGKSYALADFAPKKVLLFAYPKDNTPGCTIENKEFSDRITDFEKLGIQVIGISKDSVIAHEKFATGCNLKTLLLADEDAKLLSALGAITEKSMFGKKYMGIERSTFLINTDTGKVEKEWRKVTPIGHAAKLLSELSTMK